MIEIRLNNLVYFSTVIWYETTYNAYVYQQAKGRIGQNQSVDIFATFYKGTGQKLAINLLTQKVTASLQVGRVECRGGVTGGRGDG